MVNINLTAWREHKTHYEARILRNMLLGTVLIVLFISIVSVVLTQAEASHLTATLEQLESEDKQHRITQQVSLAETHRDEKIQELSSQLIQYRSLMQDRLSVFLKEPHPAICFTRIKKEKSTVTFSGYAKSTFDVLTFLDKQSGVHHLPEIHLDRTTSSLHSHRVAFQFHLHDPAYSEGLV